jgi:transketolase
MTAMRAQAADTVCELFRQDPRVAVVLAEISVERFQPAFDHDPSRALNVGIMEQTMVGVAAGFAMEGYHPVVHTITPFAAERALEQLKLDFANQALGGLVITVGASYDYAAEGPTHHAPGDVQAIMTIPGAEVLVPGAAGEVDALIRATYDNGRLTYLRTQVSGNADPRDVAPGRLMVERRGAAATVIAVGPMLDRTLEATAGMDVTVLYATTVTPFDADTLNRELAGNRVVVVEPFYAGTMAAPLAEALAGRRVGLHSIGVPRAEIRSYGTPEQIDAELGLDAAGIRAQLAQLTAPDGHLALR